MVKNPYSSDKLISTPSVKIDAIKHWPAEREKKADPKSIPMIMIRLRSLDGWESTYSERESRGWQGERESPPAIYIPLGIYIYKKKRRRERERKEMDKINQVRTGGRFIFLSLFFSVVKVFYHPHH